MSLKDQIMDDIKSAMRAKEAQKLGTLRMLSAALKQKEVDERIELKDEDINQILNKLVKQRQDSIKQFQLAKRQDLVDKEVAELEYLKVYMPEPLSDEEVIVLIDSAIKETAAESMKDMGKLMNLLRPQIQGRTDMGKIGALIKNKLS